MPTTSIDLQLNIVCLQMAVVSQMRITSTSSIVIDIDPMCVWAFLRPDVETSHVVDMLNSCQDQVLIVGAEVGCINLVRDDAIGPMATVGGHHVFVFALFDDGFHVRDLIRGWDHMWLWLFITLGSSFKKIKLMAIKWLSMSVNWFYSCAEKVSHTIHFIKLLKQKLF